MSTSTTTGPAVDPAVDLADVQAILLRGFRRIEALPHAYFGFVTLGSEASARGVVEALQRGVTSCTAWDRGDTDPVLNLGFTAAGLRLLGLDTTAFPQDFVDGMASRARILGDEGSSAPERWEPGYRSPELHAIVFVQGTTPAGVDAGKLRLMQALEAAPGAHLLFEEVGNDFPDRDASEHFGFVDGIGQPYVDGSGLTPYPGEGTPEPDGTWSPVATGSFLLGHTDEFGHNDYPDPPFKNGSYIAFRKLDEHVVAFREYLARMAAHGSGSVEKEAARLMGRWRSGAPLELAPDVDDPTLARDWERNNDFRYASDAAGLQCPHGAHARRGNPRADPTGPTLQQVREHRIIRRSIPYGPWLPEGQPDDGIARGIYFLVVNASLAHQFEYVQQNWMNGSLSSTALTTEVDKDPIVGSNDGTGKFVAPTVDEPTIGWSLPRFVDVRGGTYVFVPSLSTLRTLAGSP